MFFTKVKYAAVALLLSFLLCWGVANVFPLLSPDMDKALHEIVLNIEKENNDEKSNKKPGEIKDYFDEVYHEHLIHFKQSSLSKLVPCNNFQNMQAMFLPVSTPPPKFIYMY